MTGQGVPAMAKGKRQPQGEMSFAPRLMHPATSMPAGGTAHWCAAVFLGLGQRPFKDQHR